MVQTSFSQRWGQERKIWDTTRYDSELKSMVEESGEIRNTDRDSEDRFSTVESANIAPETVNSESGIVANLVMMERIARKIEKERVVPHVT